MSARKAAYRVSQFSLGIRKILYGNPHFYRGTRRPAYGYLAFSQCSVRRLARIRRNLGVAAGSAGKIEIKKGAAP